MLNARGILSYLTRSLVRPGNLLYQQGKSLLSYVQRLGLRERSLSVCRPVVLQQFSFHALEGSTNVLVPDDESAQGFVPLRNRGEIQLP